MSSTSSRTLLAVGSYRIPCHLHRTIHVCPHHSQSSIFKFVTHIHECVYYYLQDFDGDSVHPPNVTIEDKKVNAFPVDSMFLNRLRHYYTIDYTVHSRIVRIRFHQEWRPIKLHRCVIILFMKKPKRIKNYRVNVMSLVSVSVTQVFLLYLDLENGERTGPV